MTKMQAAAAIFALGSAVLWFWSALVAPAIPLAYVSGPPKEIVRSIKRQGLLNAAAAATTGIGALLQFIALLSTKT